MDKTRVLGTIDELVAEAMREARALLQEEEEEQNVNETVRAASSALVGWRKQQLGRLDEAAARQQACARRQSQEMARVVARLELMEGMLRHDVLPNHRVRCVAPSAAGWRGAGDPQLCDRTALASMAATVSARDLGLRLSVVTSTSAAAQTDSEPSGLDTTRVACSGAAGRGRSGPRRQPPGFVIDLAAYAARGGAPNVPSSSAALTRR